MINKLKTEAYNDLTKRGVIDEIRKFTQDQLDLCRRQMLNDEAYSKAAWPYYQASVLGQQKALLKLLDYLPENNND